MSQSKLFRPPPSYEVLDLQPNKEDAFRFIVGVPGSARSSEWRVWCSAAGDVYLGARDIVGENKISLHVTGKCHVAFNRSQGAGRFKLPSRFQEMWEDHSMEHRSFSVCFPREHLSPEVVSDSGKAVWLEPPYEGQALQLGVYISRQTTASYWPDLGDVRHVARVLGPTRTAYVAYRYQAITDEDRATFAEVLRRARGMSPPSLQSDPSARVLWFNQQVKGQVHGVELSANFV